MPPRRKEEPKRQGTLLQAFGATGVSSLPEDEPVNNNKPDFFGSIQNYFTKSYQVTSKTEGMEPYIQARFISMAGAGFDAATAYNRLSSRLPRWARAVVLYWLTPATGRAPCMNYIKGEKNEDTDAMKDILSRLVSHFKCNTFQARQIYTELEAQVFDVYAFFGQKTPRNYVGGKVRGKDDIGVVKLIPGVPKKAPKRGNWNI